jgi:hypothetical protein
MLRSLSLFSLLTLSIFVVYFKAQVSATAAAQASAQTPAPTPPAEPRKAKKLWTNENLRDASGPISVVGTLKDPAKTKPNPGKPADPGYAANVKKQLDKLQAESDDLDKQVLQLKNFSQGEPSPTAGVQLHKGYDRDPVEVQIRELQEKKKQLQDKMTALFDEARKKGVEPGQLR